MNISPTLLFIGTFGSLLPRAQAQTLTQATSVPISGRMENHNLYYDGSPGALPTAGTGVIWDASGVVDMGSYSYYTFMAPTGTPYAATYGSATICAQVESNSFPTEYRYWHADAGIAELLGVNTEIFSGGRTHCTFPFSLGDSFTDTYVISGITTTDSLRYVANGSIQAPWGTIPNVVMFSINGGVAYLFYSTDNVLADIGSYVPGFSFEVHQVTVFSGLEELTVPALGIAPNLTGDRSNVTVPFAETCNLVVTDAYGREVRTEQGVNGSAVLEVSGLAAGAYQVRAMANGAIRASGRLFVVR